MTKNAEKKVGRKIAIVARAPSSRYQAPFADESVEIWTLSPMGPPNFHDLPRFDRWYELHNPIEKNVECPGYIDWMASQGDKVWLRAPHPKMPQANVFPIAYVLEHFQRGFANKFRYYNNSVSLMMAQCIWELESEAAVGRFGEMALYGVDMCQNSEYGTQRPSCEVFIGWAAGAGIRVIVPEVCDMLKTLRIYGIEDKTAYEAKLEAHGAELANRLEQHHQALNDAKHQHVGAASAHGELTQLIESLNGAAEPVKQAIAERMAILEKIGTQNQGMLEKLDSEIKLTTGALEENRYVRQIQS